MDFIVKAWGCVRSSWGTIIKPNDINVKSLFEWVAVLLSIIVS